MSPRQNNAQGVTSDLSNEIIRNDDSRNDDYDPVIRSLRTASLESVNFWACGLDLNFSIERDGTISTAKVVSSSGVLVCPTGVKPIREASEFAKHLVRLIGSKLDWAEVTPSSELELMINGTEVRMIEDPEFSLEEVWSVDISFGTRPATKVSVVCLEGGQIVLDRS